MIYVITHKPFDINIINNENYIVIHVGDRCNSSNYFSDKDGENISEKNNTFCELTGLYWMWKNGNEKKEDTIGLVHYRRFFTTRIGFMKYYFFSIRPDILSEKQVNNILKKFDIVVPIRKITVHSVKYVYGYFHDLTDLCIVREIISDLYPKYLEIFDKEMNSHCYYYANMMICKKNILDSYSEWLFNILFELEKKLDINKYQNQYQKRVFGFLAERLLQVWIKYNGLKIKEMPVFNTEMKQQKILQTITRKISKKIKSC